MSPDDSGISYEGGDGHSAESAVIVRGAEDRSRPSSYEVPRTTWKGFPPSTNGWNANTRARL
jgi:hypothetical protein